MPNEPEDVRKARRQLQELKARLDGRDREDEVEGRGLAIGGCCREGSKESSVRVIT